ncbi:MAG: ECF transporter S component [Ruminococcaceae bacterium]|nr:ECF transporter S component [Oscillospiraceae bacterium]
MKTKTQKIVMASMLSALCCVVTMIIKIPSPMEGYLNLGDAIVLLSGWLMGPLYGFMASAIGSSLADVFSGFALYAPATFVIKGLMAFVAYHMYNVLKSHTKDTTSRIISGVTAEIVMIAGYYIFEGFMYGFGPSLVNIPANAIQGICGMIAGIILVRVFKNNHIL